VASGVSLIGPNAAIDAQGRVIWAGTGGFHTYDGAVQALPCEVWNKVFGDTQTIQGWQVTAALNTDFTEVRWDYPSATSEQNSRYVALNYAEGHWQRGTMERSAMSDKAALFSYNPYGTDTGGIGISDDTVSTLYIHEVGSDAGDDPMDEYIESWDIHFPDATDVILLNAMNPDFKSIEGEIDFTFRSRLRASQQTPKELTIAGITSTTERVGIRLRGTYISWEVGSDSLGTSWRLGDCEWDWAPDGEAR
jgi:hypothetical protein